MVRDTTSDNEARQARVDRKIAEWEARPPGGSQKQGARERKVLHELRVNKAAFNFNKVLLDYDQESQKCARSLRPGRRK